MLVAPCHGSERANDANTLLFSVFPPEQCSGTDLRLLLGHHVVYPTVTKASGEKNELLHNNDRSIYLVKKKKSN